MSSCAWIAEELEVAPPRWRFPVWPVWLAGALCEGIVRAAGYRTATLPPTGRLLHEEPRFRCPRAQGGNSDSPRRSIWSKAYGRTAAWYRKEGWL